MKKVCLAGKSDGGGGKPKVNKTTAEEEDEDEVTVLSVFMAQTGTPTPRMELWWCTKRNRTFCYSVMPDSSALLTVMGKEVADNYGIGCEPSGAKLRATNGEVMNVEGSAELWILDETGRQDQGAGHGGHMRRVPHGVEGPHHHRRAAGRLPSRHDERLTGRPHQEARQAGQGVRRRLQRQGEEGAHEGRADEDLHRRELAGQAETVPDSQTDLGALATGGQGTHRAAGGAGHH